jgi:hypothetical protein
VWEQTVGAADWADVRQSGSRSGDRVEVVGPPLELVAGGQSVVEEPVLYRFRFF